MENMDLLSIANNRFELISSLSNTIENKLKLFPEGRIEIKHIGNKTYYYHLTRNKKAKILREDDQLTQSLIQKSYLIQVKKAVKNEISVLTGFKDQYPAIIAEDIYSGLSSERKKLAKPIVPTFEQVLDIWQNKPYSPKEIKEGSPIFETLRGERVRSKSEQIIADRLFVNNIPYKYECPLKIGKTIIHPDFTILRRSDRKEIYHEHLGKTDDLKYQNDNFPRINFYILNGFVLGENLFLSFESSTTPLDVRVIDKLINEHFK